MWADKMRIGFGSTPFVWSQHFEALCRRRTAQPRRSDRAHAQHVAPVPDPVTEWRAATVEAVAVALAFESPVTGRRVEVEAGAEVVGAPHGFPKVLGKHQDRAGTEADPATTMGRVGGGQERIGRGEDAALGADQD